MMNRLFISLDIPEDILDKLLFKRNEIYKGENNYRWEPKNKLHITIKFLGDVGENLTELITDRLENIIFDKFSAEFSKFSFLGSKNKSKVLYAGLIENNELYNFYSKINEECELLGFQNEHRKFKPHLTLLRIKKNQKIDDLNLFLNKDILNLNFDFNSFSLIKSTLKPTGSEFTALKRFNLI